MRGRKVLVDGESLSKYSSVKWRGAERTSRHGFDMSPVIIRVHDGKEGPGRATRGREGPE